MAKGHTRLKVKGQVYVGLSLWRAGLIKRNRHYYTFKKIKKIDRFLVFTGATSKYQIPLPFWCMNEFLASITVLVYE